MKKTRIRNCRNDLHGVVKNLLTDVVFFLTGVVFVVVAIRVHNRNTHIGERQNIYLTEFLPINNEDLRYQKDIKNSSMVKKNLFFDYFCKGILHKDTSGSGFPTEW